jgi:hypothetical protein
VLEYHPIQSVYLFDNLPFFGSIFYIWFLLLVLLILTGKNGAKADWEKMGLVCISSLVFVAFWVIILPYGRNDYLHFAFQIETLQQTGRIPTMGGVYWDMPALALLGTSLFQITGSGIFDIMNLSLLFFPPIIAGLLYLLFTKSFKSPNIAAFATVLLILANMYLALAYTFHPNIISFVLLLAFLLILNRGQHAFIGTSKDIFIIVILIVAVSMLYFQTSLLFPLILVGLYIVQRIGKITPIYITLIFLVLIIPLVWQVYATITNFGMFTAFIPDIIAKITGGKFLDWIFFLGEKNAGGRVPLWASYTRMFWWALIYGLGTILGLINLLNVKKLSWAERVETGGLLGTIALISLATILSPGGERATQYLQYAAFFTVPALLHFFLKPGRIRQYGFTLLVILPLVLSFPTFLAHNGDVMVETFYPYEMASGKFLQRSYGNGEGLHVQNVIGAEFYYVPKSEGGGYFWSPISEEDYMRFKEEYLDDFLKRTGDNTVWLQTKRDKETGAANYGISPDDPRWQDMQQKLEQGYAHKIYDNGYVQIWKPPVLSITTTLFHSIPTR